MFFPFANGVVWGNVKKVEASRFASVHVHRDGRRRNHRGSGGQDRQGPEKVLVGRDTGERQGEAISLGRG